jgi:hypothetical protein
MRKSVPKFRLGATQEEKKIVLSVDKERKREQNLS